MYKSFHSVGVGNSMGAFRSRSLLSCCSRSAYQAKARRFFTERMPSLSPTELYRFRPWNEMIYTKLAKVSEINEVTLARIRDGERTRRDTANKLLRTLSQVLERPLSLRNVTGINIMVNKRMEAKAAKGEQSAA